jgi:hypothetical protein
MPLFPPRHRKTLHEAILREIRQERVVSSRSRVDFRGVKRKMSNYNLRPRKRQRTRRIDVSKRIRIVKRTGLGLAPRLRGEDDRRYENATPMVRRATGRRHRWRK